MNKYMLEWSKSQNAFHIDTVDKCIERNLQAMVSDYKRDYVLLCIGTRELCESCADRYRHYLKLRMQ